jgi:hypothetical protein
VIISIFAAMIDFVHDILFGIDYPGLVKALDPITLGLLVGQGIQQFGKIREAKQQEEAAQAQMDQGQDLYDKMVSEFESGKYDASLSQDIRDTAEQQRILAEQVADQAAQRGTASIQSALAASRYGDPRSAALIPGQLQRVEAGIQQAELSGLQQKVAADASVASAQQRIDEQNRQLQQSLGAMKLRRGAARMDAGELAAQQARAAAAAARTGLYSTIGQGLAMQFGGGGGSGKGTDKTNSENALAPRAANIDFGDGPIYASDAISGELVGRGSIAPMETVDPSGGESFMDRVALGEFLGTQEGRTLPQVPLLLQRQRLGLPLTQGLTTLQKLQLGIFEEGGQYEFANKGGEVHMTEGEFSHKTNKKALIDEETGIKEAELTGDEAMVRDGENVLVFNPNQQSTIESLVNKGDAKGLMKKMKALLKKFNKQNV